MSNRIATAIALMEPRIESMDADKRARLTEHTAITFEEGFVYQETKSWAQAAGLITHDEAITVYAAFTGTRWADGTSLATKIAITKLMEELLTAKRARS